MPTSPQPHEEAGKVEGSKEIDRFKELTKQLIAVSPIELRIALKEQSEKNRVKPKA